MVLHATTLLLVTGLLAICQTGQQQRRPSASSAVAAPIFHTDPARYQEVQKVHSGAGSLRFMTLVDGSIFNTNLLFIHRGVLSPHSSIGHHIHRHIEEMYVIFDNRARFTVNGAAAELGAGAMVPCLMGNSHGIYNPTDHET
jgi:mannose-6-phosphate isomerase-like protein (cupin superfamily)